MYRRSEKPYKSRFSSKAQDYTLKLFFDLYTVNHLWFWTIGAQKSGYHFFNILPAPKEERIDETFEQVVTDMKKRVIKALEWSVRGEISHFYGYGPGSCRSYFSPRHPIHNFIKRHGNRKLRHCPLEVIEEAFNMNGWDADYGGKKWGKAVYWLIQLKKSSSLAEDCFIIDRIFDLQHNNGFVLNKTEFRILENRRMRFRKKDMCPLTYRARAQVTDMLEHCSHRVRGLVIANSNYLPKLPHA
jgi:hypothetical protein